MPFISESVTDRQFLLNMSFTYFGLIYYIIKLQNSSSLDARVIATKMSKWWEINACVRMLVSCMIIMLIILNMAAPMLCESMSIAIEFKTTSCVFC